MLLREQKCFFDLHTILNVENVYLECLPRLPVVSIKNVVTWLWKPFEKYHNTSGVDRLMKFEENMLMGTSRGEFILDL